MAAKMIDGIICPNISIVSQTDFGIGTLTGRPFDIKVGDVLKWNTLELRADMHFKEVYICQIESVLSEVGNLYFYNATDLYRHFDDGTAKGEFITEAVVLMADPRWGNKPAPQASTKTLRQESIRIDLR